MKIGSIGCDYSHDSSFVMDRPNGAGAGLFLFVKTEASFVIAGEAYDVKANSFVLLRRDTPIKYSAKGEKYVDDWFYFDYDERDLEWLSRIGIGIDIPVYIDASGEIAQLFRMLAYEHYSTERFNEELEGALLECMLYKLARLTHRSSESSPGQHSAKSESLTNIRTKIYSVPEAELSIDRLAAEVGMSRSGFQHSYKKMFGVSPIFDIITSRLDKAKRLLSGTSMSVEEVSLSCGYRSSYSFMRQFRNKTGKTPTEYRLETKNTK
ncbi:AraC family transcriptional regulator [Ruminococcus sp. NK3A76]|uniref:AraC family transcriptional regulator n=1 Tax=Ruminococcus sp. NK3A76 TaxID=877411 RepID=UPI000490E86B|nr:AraC family transcriptional regulator [Ruminococcus sp. NK3A76]